MAKHLKNIEFERALELPSLVEYQAGQVVSRTLAQNKAVSLTLFAFEAGEEISSHESSGDAMVTVFEGIARITIGEREHVLTGGQTIVMPSGVPHALFAEERFKMLLTVVFPQQ
ncbi:MAG: cupin domain-containing protein [Clostridiales bacterium]|jgi:quercetin dioxygenase-like cupin family protein|nr:cupin domain-containing protein [Clostridiales bacterium]